MKRADLWIVGAAVLSFCLLAVTVELPAEEDAFIYYRYAWNAAHGHGLVFNLGDPLEGFSGPAWMAVLVLIARAGLDLPTTASLLGLLCGAGTLMATWWLGRAAGLDRVGRLAAVVVLAMSYPFVVWSRSGLETPFYSLALTLAAGAYLVAEYPISERAETSVGCRAIAALATVLVCLCRPEGLLLVMILVADRLTDRRDGAGALRYAVPAAAGFGSYLIWRVHTFHSLVPNTSVKLYPLLLDRSIGQSLAYVAYLGIVPLVFPILALAIGGGARSERRRLGVLVAVVGVLSFGFNFLAGGDYRPGFRYFIPTLPLLLVAVWLALGRVSVAASSWSRPATVLLFILLIAAPLRLFAHNPPRVHDWREQVFEPWRDPLEKSNPELEITRWLDRHTPQDGVVAFGQMGKIPYALARNGHDVTFIDTLGLVDREIAGIYRFDRKIIRLWRDYRAGMSMSAALEAGRRARADRVAASIVQRHPDFILIETALEDYRMMQALLENAQFRTAYRDLGGFPPEGPADLRIYARSAEPSMR